MTLATNVSVPFRPSPVGDEEAHSFASPRHSGWLTISKALAFEHDFAQHADPRPAVAQCSRTLPLYLLLEALGHHETDDMTQLQAR
jgi:dTDP-4-amino-4,6-dideoxygalactose transaminase